MKPVMFCKTPAGLAVAAGAMKCVALSADSLNKMPLL
jgi:hypothetical protein